MAALVGTLLTLSVLSAETRENFDAGWRFARFGPMPDGSTLAEPPGLQEPASDDAAWRQLDLPHDWGIEGPFRAELPNDTGKLPWAGIGWYRKTFTAPAAGAGERTYLDIDGAMSHPRVWLNGQLVGEWAYGYASFRLDLTPHLRPGAANTLAIRLDNPPGSSRWYPGGGLYRSVHLVRTGPVHVAHHGLFLTTPRVTDAAAELMLQIETFNHTAVASTLTAEVAIIAPDGVEALRQALPLGQVAANAGATFRSRLTLPRPQRWDLATPHLYRAHVTLRDPAGAALDTTATTFGVRDVRFDPAVGLLLNGRKIALQGVCNHHDLGALGAAFNVRAAERQLEILQAMGVNALRTSHNPPAPELLDLCDRMGILVFDEAFDGWAKPKTPRDYGRDFAAWHERDLRAWVRRDRNHPSVIAWSVGNEVLEQKPPEKHPEGPALLRALREIVRSEDPTRPATTANDHPKTAWSDFGREPELFGFNYKPRSYAKFHEDFPRQPFYGSETASTVSTRGEYFFPVSDKRDGGFFNYQVSSYDLYVPPWAQTPDTEFAAQDANPTSLGEFVWTGFDYLGEPTPYGNDASVLLNFPNEAERAAFQEKMKQLGGGAPSRSSYFGIVDLAGFPKDRYYLYQSRWRAELPMAHLLPHWTWPGREGEVTPVHVYTSGDEAELFLNGVSLGRKKKGPGDYRLRWDEVKYTPGELKVVAYKHGEHWAEARQRTAGPAARLELSVDRATITADGRDLAFVTVRVLDAAGVLVPDARPLLHFAVTGAGEFVAADNGDPTDLRTFAEPQRAAFHGLGLAILRGRPGVAGDVTLRVEADGLPAATLTFKTQP